MNTDHEEEDALKVWKRSLPEDQEEIIEEQQARNIGTVAVLIGGIIAIIVLVVTAGILLFDKYKHHVGL